MARRTGHPQSRPARARGAAGRNLIVIQEPHRIVRTITCDPFLADLFILSL